MSESSGLPASVVLLVRVPLLLIWAFVLWDILRRERMSGASKALWALACSLVWPLMIVYLLARPQLARAARTPERSDPHGRLVRVALDHEAGRLGSAEFLGVVAALRAGSVRTDPHGGREREL